MMRNLQKATVGGTVERDSGVATVECESHTNGGSSGSSFSAFRSNAGRGKSFQRPSSIFALSASKSFRSSSIFALTRLEFRLPSANPHFRFSFRVVIEHPRVPELRLPHEPFRPHIA